MASISSAGTPWREHAAAWIAACAAAIVFTWPLAPRATDHLLGAMYAWDAYTNAMLMGSRIDAVVRPGPLSIFDAYYFAPLPDAIVFNENLFGLSLLFAPFYLLGKNPLFAYNLTLLLSLGLSVFFTYLLVRRLTGSPLAGFLSGIAFAFSPYVVFELGRIQLVATQWIPACFYFLHRALEGRRVSDIACLWFAYLLQIGTCLYYAMFLLPLLGALALWLWLRERPPRRTVLTFAAFGVVAAGIALALIHPYFTERKHFELERGLAFAASYDGKLAFFGHVPESNLGLPWLRHHGSTRGAHEEIAFPGFTVLLLGIVALGARVLQGGRARGAAGLERDLARWAGAVALATLCMLLVHSMLAGVLVLAVLAWRRRATRRAVARAPHVTFYAALLGFAVLLFLGLEPLVWTGRPVHGLYYYLYTYFPGFNGMRKVSRQAVMTTFLAAVLASFGSALLFSKVKTRGARWLAFAGLLVAMTLELRSFPHPLEAQWAGASVPKAYRFLATLPQTDIVATTPQDDGKQRFRGDAGMALHNYLALYHKHRFADGQSSFTPPVTDLVRRALSDLPSESANRVLRSVGVNRLLIHGADLPEEREDLVNALLAQTDRYRLAFRDGDDAVFTLLDDRRKPALLAEVPALPRFAHVLEQSELRPRASLEPGRAHYAADGRRDSFWSSRTPQAAGQALEVGLVSPRRLIALEIENPGHELYLPMSYRLESAIGNEPYRVVQREPELVLFRAQIYTPKQFVFRIVLPQPVLADRLRLVVEQPMPAIDVVVHEIRVYEAP